MEHWLRKKELLDVSAFGHALKQRSAPRCAKGRNDHQGQAELRKRCKHSAAEKRRAKAVLTAEVIAVPPQGTVTEAAADAGVEEIYPRIPI